MAAFKARLQTGDPTAVALDQLVREAGLELKAYEGPLHGAGEINSYRSLERVYQLEGPEPIRQTLWVCAHAWPTEPGVSTRYTLRALGYLFGHFGASLDRERLLSVLKDRRWALWRSDAIALQAVLGGEQWTNHARVWLKAYNGARRGGLLPDPFAEGKPFTGHRR
jgi:hypothetical protein